MKKIAKVILVFAMFFSTIGIYSKNIEAGAFCTWHWRVKKEGTQGTGYSWSASDTPRHASGGEQLDDIRGAVAYKQSKQYRAVMHYGQKTKFYGPWKKNSATSSYFKENIAVSLMQHRHCVE